MPIVIQPFQEEHQPAVEAFNERLRAATNDPTLVFYRRALPSWLPKIEGSPIYNEYFVALEDGQVRGAYALKYERFFLAGHGECAVACYHHPLSEGVVDRKFSAVGGLMLRDALWREPMLYALGMGGLERPLPQMLKKMGWRLEAVPFFFRVVHPYRFLRHMKALRTSPWRRWLMDFAAFTGTGWVGLRSIRYWKQQSAPRVGPFDVNEIEEFSDWTDDLWHTGKEASHLASVRDRATLSRLYPRSENHLTKLCVQRQGRPVGWAVIGERRKDPKFGDLRVGSIVDCWGLRQNAASVILAATRLLEEKGMDLIVSNQSHRMWCRALHDCGFFQAGSNFIFAVSKKYSALLQGTELADCHLTRANGDGLPRNF